MADRASLDARILSNYGTLAGQENERNHIRRMRAAQSFASKLGGLGMVVGIGLWLSKRKRTGSGGPSYRDPLTHPTTPSRTIPGRTPSA